MRQTSPCHKNINYLWHLNCVISFESCMVRVRVESLQTTVNNKVRVEVHIFALDLVK